MWLVTCLASCYEVLLYITSFRKPYHAFEGRLPKSVSLYELDPYVARRFDRLLSRLYHFIYLVKLRGHLVGFGGIE